MALVSVGTILHRMFDGPAELGGGAFRVDADGYRLDCCDACTAWASSRRVIAAHRVRCDIFAWTVLDRDLLDRADG